LPKIPKDLITNSKMTEEKQKIVIVIGAGASEDFVLSGDKKLHEKHGDIKYEIWENTQYNFDKNPDKNSRYFLSENNRKNYSFPSGEALIKLIGNKEKITKIFWNEICESFRNVVFEKINKNDQSLINLHNIFCDYLINQDRSKNNEINIIELNLFQITGNFANYLGKKVSEFKNIINFCYHENNVNRTSVETNLSHMHKNIEENLFDNQKNDKKDYKFYKIIIANSNSRYLQISHLVNYYQPFSIDELLDSIKTEKIDVLEPLKIKKEDLKTILKSDEEDSKKLENQFRNELVNAGKTLIALFFLRSEKKELFDNQNPENDSKIWYRHIRNLIINSAKNADEIKKQIQNLTIISFNYDRSLDYYLRTRLRDYYNEIKERVFYPYGKLAEEDWDKSDYGSFERDGFNPYNEDELEKIRKLGQGLRVIGELDKDLSKNILI